MRTQKICKTAAPALHAHTYGADGAATLPPRKSASTDLPPASLSACIAAIAPRFNAVCALLAVFVLLFGALALSDPDRIIAEYNVDRYIAGTLGLDVETLSNEYSDSAIPALVRLRTALEDRPDTENFKKIIDHRLDVWQRTNGDPAKNIFCETLPRIRARRAVQGMLTED